MKVGKTFFTGLFITCLSLTAAYAQVSVSVGISVHTAPPPLPVYIQPPCPADGYIWTPGYWAYGPGGYYWVAGMWVRPPHPGFLWTPAYWGFADGVYGFHAGYWGPHIGFYGGINYGCGYNGSGYVGGRWEGSRFLYNTAVTNVNTTVVHNTYINNTVINNSREVNHNSFNGPGGVTARPNRQELLAMNERHQPATSEQANHQQIMSRDRSQLASVNHGRPSSAINANNNHHNSNASVQHLNNSGMVHRVESSMPQEHRQIAMQRNMRVSQPGYQNRPHFSSTGHAGIQPAPHGFGRPQGRPEGHRRG